TSGGIGMKESESVVLSRIKPVGQVVMAEASGPKGNLTGEQVFTQVCKTCHETGVAGAHKGGDKAAWAHVIKQGAQGTLEHPSEGIRAMPPKGGNPDLTDVEVERAVVYMANKAGANWKEPAPPANVAATPAATPPPAAASTAGAAAAPASPASAAAS